SPCWSAACWCSYGSASPRRSRPGAPARPAARRRGQRLHRRRLARRRRSAHQDGGARSLARRDLARDGSGRVPGALESPGAAAAPAAGALWGTMYIPYRKAYLTGMSPLAFVTFFTVGELGMMSALALADRGGLGALVAELSGARDVLFWLLLGGFVWVVGDLFQQYAAKYVGISRGIPLSNTNQLWGLVWGLLVFGELHGGARATYAQVIGGSLLMALGAA